jgi:hypothetical protein
MDGYFFTTIDQYLIPHDPIPQPPPAPPPPPPPVPEPVELGWAGYWKDVGKMFKGYGNAIVNTGTAAWQMTTQPVQTAQGLYHAAMHPMETIEAVIDSYREKSQTIEGQAEIIGEILLTFATGGATKAATKSATVAKIGSQLRKTRAWVPETPLWNRLTSTKKKNTPEQFYGMCFARDTLVSTPQGLRAIRDIEPGETVWAFDFDSGDWLPARVEQRIDNVFSGTIVRIGTSEEESITATAYHPFWVLDGPDLDQRSTPRELADDEDQGQSLPGRWVNSHELRIGDAILGQDGERRLVLRLEQWYDPHFEVCNLTVARQHTFAVGRDRILVHNTSGSTVGGQTPSANNKIPVWSSTKKKTAVQNAYDHWVKHRSEFPEYANATQYVRGAKQFIDSPPPGTLIKYRPNREVLYYHPATNTFAVRGIDGAPKTMFRPTAGINYWNNQ